MADEWEVKSVSPASEWDVLSTAPATTTAPAPAAAPSNMDVVQNAAYGGAASIPDMLLNAPNQVMNLGRAAIGTGATALGRPDLAPDLKEDPNYTKTLLEKLGLIKQGVTPQGGQKALDVLVRGGVGGALTGGASIPRTVAGAGMGALSSGAGAGTEALASKAGLSDSASAMLGGTAGLLAPKGVAGAAALSRFATDRGPAIPPERLDAYRAMTKEGARPSAASLIYGEQNKNVAGQQKVANNLWNESVGLPAKQDFGIAEISQAKNNLSNDYNRLFEGRQVTFDKPFFDTFKSLFDKQRLLSETGVTFAEARPIIATLERIANLPEPLKQRINQLKDVPADNTSPGVTKRALQVIDDALKAGASGEWKMDAKDYNEVRSILGKDAQRSRRDTNRSGLLWKMQQALDDAADRSMPDIKHELGTTRGRYENLMILSDAMEGRGPGFVTPAQIGKEVAQRAGHRSLYPNQNPLKELGRYGLSLSGDAAIDGGVNLSGVAAHIPKGGISMTAVERALATPLTALRAKGMGKEGFNESARNVEENLKEVARRSVIPLAAEKKEEPKPATKPAPKKSKRAYDDAEKERAYQEWKASQESTQ